eukprot:scaffold8601_cov180-Ochromonas_danica.AAC.10
MDERLINSLNRLESPATGRDKSLALTRSLTKQMVKALESILWFELLFVFVFRVMLLVKLDELLIVQQQQHDVYK